MMKLHLVGGFLGSGKTTAILNAAKLLLSQNALVGIITNDQGKYLVDTAFFRLNNLPTTEVTGGCFCCNYQDLETLIDKMQGDIQPDVLFAESVGSCTDLIATVINPLLQVSERVNNPTSFSVFVDARLMRLFLLGSTLPFSDNVIYIFEKQIEESGLLVVNKIDLISPTQLDLFFRDVKTRYPEKTVIFQNSLAENGVSNWLSLISQYQALSHAQAISVDYEIYGEGERQLSWLDLKFSLEGSQEDLNNAFGEFLHILVEKIVDKYSVGHMKLIVTDHYKAFKISFTSQDDWNSGVDVVQPIQGNWVEILVNARVELPKEILDQVINGAIEQVARVYHLNKMVAWNEAFIPNFPKPTYRLK